MSIQPSLSESKNAQPGPVDSGRYFSGERSFACVHAMPLSDEATISNGYCGAAVTFANNLCGDEKPADTESAEVAASPATISRRLSSLLRKELRRLKFVAAKLLRAPRVRCRLVGPLVVDPEFLFGLLASAKPAVCQCQVVVSRRIAFFQSRCRLQRR